MKLMIAVISVVILTTAAIGVADAGDKHLFYLNGCCLKKVGTTGYKAIVKKLEKDGFKVVFDARYDDSDAEVQSSAQKTADQVKALIAAGTPAEDITVSGYSLGSVITMYASIALDNPKVNYVLLAGCPVRTTRSFDIDYAKIRGRVLSIIDKDDDRFGSCGNRISGAAAFKEVTIQTGSGHKGFRLADSGAMKAWKEPLKAWTTGQ